MIRTPRFVFINRAPSRMWCVSAVSGVCSEMKSAPASKSSSSSTSSTCRLRASVADRYGSYATTRIPKLIARRLSSLPIRPMPITPSVLLYSSTPSKFFLSQALLRTFASACGIFRATQSNNENACSAVEMVFPPGAFNTTTPRRVATSTSTLSTPTPARPTTRSLAPAFKISAVTLVWLRTTSALNAGINSTSSRSFKPVLTVTCSAFSRASSSTPRGEMESAIRTFGGVITASSSQVSTR